MNRTICLNCHQTLAKNPYPDYRPHCSRSCSRQFKKLSHEDQAIRKLEATRYEKFLKRQNVLDF